jgi:hypothetical protein
VTTLEVAHVSVVNAPAVRISPGEVTPVSTVAAPFLVVTVDV